MNKETISFKMEDYTITLCRGEEESEEIAQKRLAKYVNCLYNIAMKLMIKYLKNYSELQTDVKIYNTKRIPKIY